MMSASSDLQQTLRKVLGDCERVIGKGEKASGSRPKGSTETAHHWTLQAVEWIASIVAANRAVCTVSAFRALDF
jgi:hypothetical protein